MEEEQEVLAPEDQASRESRGFGSVTPMTSIAGAASAIRSQGTIVEMGRAAAEVAAAIRVAQEAPRDPQRGLNTFLETCRMKEVADRAFFKYPRAGKPITGVSIHFATEAARCWGNVEYGIRELARDDEQGQSEMLAWAWDVQTNTRSSTTFIVPHIRDKADGGKVLTESRDIYENNANMGARRLREMIIRILPPWFVEQGKVECRKTLESGGNRPLPERRAKAIELYSVNLGIALPRLEALHGPVSDWTEVDLANLEVNYRAIRRGEIAPEEQYPRLEALQTKAGGAMAIVGRAVAATGQSAAKVAEEPITTASGDEI